jgi:hypothetical protein
MRRASVVVAFFGLVGALAAPAAPPSEGEAAFARLKSLAGNWEASPIPGATAPSVSYELTSGGTVVMETLFGGSPHEMRSLYHIVNGELVLAHYCGLGNQPRMRLRKGSRDPLFFDFDGGTNFDPAKDMHIHSGWIKFVDERHIEAEWSVYQGGQQVGAHKIILTRKD